MSQKPFYGLLGQPQYEQPYQPKPSPALPTGHVPLCGYCGQRVEMKETAVDVLIGVVGPGPKSGRAMVLPGDDYADLEENQATLHLECCIQWMDERMGGGLFPALCENCSAALEGDE